MIKIEEDQQDHHQDYQQDHHQGYQQDHHEQHNEFNQLNQSQKHESRSTSKMKVILISVTSFPCDFILLQNFFSSLDPTYQDLHFPEITDNRAEDIPNYKSLQVTYFKKDLKILLRFTPFPLNLLPNFSCSKI
jgi:hypothetical protein